MPTRVNHYVPQWYQCGFLAPGASKFVVLDKHPETKTLADGRIVQTQSPIQHWGTKRCFHEVDLYTTFFGEDVNDEIERLLFGPIDAKGADAVSAFLRGDPVQMHHLFQDFFSYLDAQKLRTPKGLDWIRASYPKLSHLELMQEMQGLRLMYCQMWVESVREIVTAEASDIKFLLTDNPVTTYNPALPPSAKECDYPYSARAELAGTQTIFPLDANTCLILTHVEWAKNPDAAKPTSKRTNARFRGTGYVHTHAHIRTRALKREDVAAINLVLKEGAKRYIAAADKAWLYPEQVFAGPWETIKNVLLPKDFLWEFGGEMFIKFEDGHVHHQDAYGRTSGAHKYLRRKTVRTDLASDEACGCGSGRTYDQCCQHIPLEHRPNWEVFGIRERNLMFCRAVEHILGLDGDKTWEDVRKGISNEQVKQIHETLAMLWPADTNLAELLPRPRSDTFRAVYMGALDARMANIVIVGMLSFFDEIVIANPFVNPAIVRPEFNPIQSPDSHKVNTVENVLLMLSLWPSIENGMVHVVPDIGDYDLDYAQSSMSAAGVRISGEDKIVAREDSPRLALWMYKTLIAINRMPVGALACHFKAERPKSSPEEITKLVAAIEETIAEDPFALLQPASEGEHGSFLVQKGFALESGLFFATLTGAVLYTDYRSLWQHAHRHATEHLGQTDSGLKLAIEACQSIEIPMDSSAEEIFDDRESGKSEPLRAVMRDIVESARQHLDSAWESELEMKIAKANKLTEVELAASSRSASARVLASFPIAGFHRPAIWRHLLTFGQAHHIQPVPAAFLVEFT
ncbi:DUF4238 domain-containing protein [Paraburkholderia kirstenboschensis]|uniref:DUF4238 domain-containing protein n=1 Tax=Paraburkholderia kirstenboschensis TaxID=1245436 RepID=A0ABZ0EKI9_9BURK|nr:DUF4238 domain-containing protein [Paraburkholderia kirstenboschensis]WOD16959.1 DUF4238 domain-containing protein [Paraburkholderia kirstenboschensis]